jgi:iron complex outermembrane receptor protein
MYRENLDARLHVRVLPALLLVVSLWQGFLETSVFADGTKEQAKDYFAMSLEDLMNVPIVSATLREERLLDTPAPIYVVTSQEIREKGYYTLKDVMNDIPGFEDLSDDNENIVGVRGAYASTTNKILILINGHRMNSLSLGRYNTDQYIGVDAIDRIEFVMGPGSVLYGTGALVGVVNIITKKGSDLDGVFLRGSASTFQNQGSASWGMDSNDLDVFTNFTYLDGEGDEISQPAELDVVPAGQVKAPGNIYWNRYPNNWSALVSARYRDSEIHVRQGHFARATPRVPNGSFYDYDQEEANGFPPLYEQDDFFIDVSRQFKFEDGSKLTITPSFHAIHLRELSWMQQYGANRMPPLGSRNGQDSDEVHWQLQSHYEREWTEKFSTMIGIDALYADFQRSDAIVLKDGNDFNIIPRRTDLTGWLLLGSFGELTWKPVRPVTVTAGLRFDDFQDQADPKITPRLGIVYRPTEQWSFKALYGESYLSPQWDHTRINTQEFAFLSNPNIRPEELRAGDFIVQYQNKERGLMGWVDFFVNGIDGIITPRTEAGKQIYMNYGDSQYWGAETGFHYDILKELRLSASYSFVDDTGQSDAQFIQNGQIKNIPRYILRYGLRYQALDKLVFNIWGRSYPEVQVSDLITGENSVEGWTQLDFSALYLTKRFELRATVTNLTDEQYEVGGSTSKRPLPRYGRGIELSLGYRF